MAEILAEDGAQKTLDRLSRSERYHVRKARYRPGSLLAVELVNDPAENFHAPKGSYGLALIRDCNWLGHIALFNFNTMFHKMPTLEQARAIAVPDNLWFWIAYTGDGLIHSEHLVVLGDVDPWIPDEWRTLATIDRKRGEVEWLRFAPRRLPVHERSPLTPKLDAELGHLPEWPTQPSGAIVPSTLLTRSLTDKTAVEHIPIGPERTAAFKRVAAK